MRDDIDAFIIAHNKSMTQQDMADKLGVNKSTISRRMAALRESGDIAEADSRATGTISDELREKLRGYAVSRSDRLQALAELRDILRDELPNSGGQSLSRISSEYRKTLEELEALSTELEIAQAMGKRIKPLEVAQLKKAMGGKYADVCDKSLTASIIDDVLAYVAELGIIESYSPLVAILSEAETDRARDGAQA